MTSPHDYSSYLTALSDSAATEQRRQQGLELAEINAEAEVRSTETQIALRTKKYATAWNTVEGIENAITRLRVAGGFPEESIGDSPPRSPAENDLEAIQSELKCISLRVEGAGARLGLTKGQIFDKQSTIPTVVEETQSSYRKVSREVELDLSTLDGIRSLGGFSNQPNVGQEDVLPSTPLFPFDIQETVRKIARTSPNLEEELLTALGLQERWRKLEKERREFEERQEQKRLKQEQERLRAEAERQERSERQKQARRERQEQERLEKEQKLLRAEAERQEREVRQEQERREREVRQEQERLAKLRRRWVIASISVVITSILVLLIIYSDTVRTIAMWSGVGLLGVVFFIFAVLMSDSSEKK